MKRLYGELFFGKLPIISSHCEGVLMIDYLQKGQTINGEYYASNMRQLKEAIKSKRRGELRAGVLLLQDICSCSHSTSGSRRSCGFELLPHVQYSSDLTTSDFYLLVFPKLKSHLRDRRFESDNDVMCCWRLSRDSDCRLLTKRDRKAWTSVVIDNCIEDVEK